MGMRGLCFMCSSMFSTARNSLTIRSVRRNVWLKEPQSAACDWPRQARPPTFRINLTHCAPPQPYYWQELLYSCVNGLVLVQPEPADYSDVQLVRLGWVGKCRGSLRRV